MQLINVNTGVSKALEKLYVFLLLKVMKCHWGRIFVDYSTGTKLAHQKPLGI